MAKFKVKKDKKFFWGPRWNIFLRKKNELNFKVLFKDNCLYKLSENYDQINKLTGQSYNFFPFYDKESKSWKPGHHKNSIRFGWRCVDGLQIDILAYVYINKIRKEKIMLSISPGDWIHLNFKETNGYYVFKVMDDNKTSLVKFNKNDTKNSFPELFTYRLYPYFGGKIAAPHNMEIELKYF